MPSMRHPPSRGCYGRLVMRGSSLEPEDYDYPGIESPVVAASSRRSRRKTLSLDIFRRRPSSESRNRLESIIPERCMKYTKTFGRVARRGLTNKIVSVCLLVVGLTMSLGPGLHTLLVVKPSLMIDKSIKAFNIPNHIVTKRQDAFTQALTDLRHSYSIGRGRRDVRNQVPPAKHDGGYQDKIDDNQWTSIWDDKQNKEIRISKKNLHKHIKNMVDSFYENEAKREKEFQMNAQEHLKSNADNSFKNCSDSVHRDKRSIPPDRKIIGITQAHRRWKMTLIYLAKGENQNIFTPERLESIHQVERRIMNHSHFPDFCYINYQKFRQDQNLLRYRGCAPINSLLTYFYPSKTKDGTVHYDGLGSKLDRINRTLRFAMSRDTFFWYVDDKINSTNRQSRLLRSEVQFGAPLPGYISFADRKAEQSRKFRNFIITYIDMLEQSSTDQVQVLYGGNEIFDHEVDATFWNDVRLAFFTLVFIVIFMFILTSFSLWLTCWGILSIVLSFPLALFLYREVFGVVSLGILNGAAAFLIIGIGVDDVFVFINTFRQAHHMTDLGDRLVHTIYTAGKATFFTSFTTAAAFAANVASSIPAIHDFGLFMSLIVSCCWVMVVIVMPPVINLWASFFASCENACYKGCYKCKNVSRIEVPADIAHFLDKKQGERSHDTRRDTNNDNDDSSDDVPLLQMEDVNDHEGGWPIYLGMLNQMLHDENDDPMLSLEQELEASPSLDQMVAPESRQVREGCSLTSWIQGILYHFVAKPVVRARRFIIGTYVVILIVSIGLMTQLHTATRPPQLFHRDTNLQRIMDLAANFSDSAITCDECSGFFKENAVKIEPKPAEGLPSDFSHQTPPPPPSTTTPTAVRDATISLTLPPDPASVHNDKIVTLATETKEHRDMSVLLPTKPPVPFTKPAQYDHPTLPPIAAPIPDYTSAHHSTYPSQPLPQIPDPESVDSTFDPCAKSKCNHHIARPNLELGAVVHVVFGILGIDRSNVSMEHVLTEKGTVDYDDNFAVNFELKNLLKATAIRDLCKICKLIANNTKLVKPNGSQCIPQYGIRQLLRRIPECENLPENKIVNGHRLPARAIASITSTGVQWLAFAFESTTFKGQSYFTAYNEYNEWEKYIRHIKDTVLTPNSPLINFYQTSDFWTNVMMEVVAVSSAIYGLVLSMIICITAVAIFTGHIKLLLIVGSTIFGVICLVVAIFYLVGWEMGAVEAVSLSILVGSSVDYCVHVVEGYLLAGGNPPAHITHNEGELRRWRTLAAVSHIGVSITSSALTTIVAAIPLTQTVIQPFSKFGQIVTINTSISILYTLTACIAFLSIFAPAKHKNSLKSTAVAFSLTVLVIGLFTLILFILSRCGVNIPAPNGENLFP